MFTKFENSTRTITILSLVFVLTISVAWATNSYFKSKTMSIDNYLIEQGFQEVLLWVHLQEDWVDTGDGSGYYQLHFTFGPSGAYFQEPLEIQMRGKYVSKNNEVQMYDEYGEILESTSNGMTTSLAIATTTMTTNSYNR